MTLQSGSAAPETVVHKPISGSVAENVLSSQLAAENVNYFTTLEALQEPAVVLWTSVNIKQYAKLPHSEKLFGISGSTF
jgi:hypothetical protein